MTQVSGTFLSLGAVAFQKAQSQSGPSKLLLATRWRSRPRRSYDGVVPVRQLCLASLLQAAFTLQHMIQTPRWNDAIGRSSTKTAQTGQERQMA